MRRIIFIAIMSMLSCVLFAQDMYVYSVIGVAEKQVNGKWQVLQKRDQLSDADLIRVGDNSALSVLDRKAEKLYSFSQTNSKKMSELIANYKGKQSYSANFVSHASKALFNGGSDRISHEAAGCTYRGDIIENDIAQALVFRAKGKSFDNYDNAATDYAVTFEVLDRETKQSLEGVVKIDNQAIFRIKNNSESALYINILDIDSQKNRAVCLPIDDATTMSHLLIPANCTIDLSTYPVQFAEPAGVDNLILIATEEPFDLRQVNNYLEKVDPAAVQKGNYPVGVYSRQILIK